jgi:non-ribosomal peptide synthetase component F
VVRSHYSAATNFTLTTMESKGHIDSISTIVEAISKVLGLEVSVIKTIAKDKTFVMLGGDSLAAILVAAECQKEGISIPARVFLQVSTLEEAITKANTCARFLDIHSTDLPIHTLASPLLSPQFIETPTTISSSHSETGDDSSSCNTTITTPDLEVFNPLSCYTEQKIISATDLLDRLNSVEWTELQLALLRETSDNHERNILTIHKTYTGEWDAQFICDVWTSTILAEPIFQDLLIDLEISPQQLLPWKIIQVETEEDLQSQPDDEVLIQCPLSYLTVVQLASTSVTVVWRVHHSLMDGFSARILHDKISRNLLGREPSVSPGPSFKDAVRELGRLREERRDATTRFWEAKRAQFTCAVGNLSLNPQRVHDVPSSQRCINIVFPEAELAAAQAQTGFTSTVYFAAAWALTLGKFMDIDQLYFGMALSGRDLPILGATEVVGPLINILPLFVQLPREDDCTTSVTAFLQHIRDGILELTEFQHSGTTEGLVEQFTSIIATQFEEFEGAEQSMLGHLNVSDMQSGTPLSLIIQGQNRLQVFYSTAHYSEEDMNNVWSVFQNGMNRLLQGDDEKPLATAIQQDLMPLEMEQTIRRWSNCESLETLDESKGDDLVTLFESVVARQPTAVAVTRGHGHDISYDDFDQAAAAVARELSWVKPNEPVCVYADRSVNWLVAIFGILKAGGVYAPLDPSAPTSMRHANFTRSGARAILFPSSTSISEDTPPAGCMRIAIDNLVEKNKAQPQNNHVSTSYPRRRIARPDDLAYICFTSGSTGQPKAVQCTHKGLVAFQKDYVIRLAAKRGQTVAQVMSPVFDGSIHEIFSALTHGATLRLPSANMQDHPFAHLQDCDSAILTPSIANALDADQYPRLRNV